MIIRILDRGWRIAEKLVTAPGNHIDSHTVPNADIVSNKILLKVKTISLVCKYLDSITIIP